MSTSDLTNASGDCRYCGGRLSNIEARRGCSLTKLHDIHRATCPGIPAKRKKETTDD